VQCLVGPPTPSYVIASLPAASLPEPLRVPTAADGVCRAEFQLAPVAATAGVTCSGSPEYVTASIPVGAVTELRLSR
jgi:hypothetical protein